MASLLNDAVSFALIPAITVLIGGLIAFIKTPTKAVSSFTQHFAAGVVFAAVALELLPKLTELHNNWALILGFISGVGLMLLIKSITGGHGHDEDASHSNNRLPWSMLTAIGVDLVIDGLLIGIALVAGEQGGFLVSLALGIEILFLGIAVTAKLAQQKVSKIITLSLLIGLALLVILGAIIGSTLISQSNDFWLEVVLSFGVAALLYLVTEELLEEAHETRDTPLITSAFFAGFLVIYLLNQQLNP